MATVGPTPGPDGGKGGFNGFIFYFIQFVFLSLVWRRTRHDALAGISFGLGLDLERRRGDVVAAVLYDDSVALHAIGDVRHLVCTVAVVMDTGLLGFTILVLRWNRKDRRGTNTVMISFVCCDHVCLIVSCTHGDEHAQLGLAGGRGINVELSGEAGGDAAAQPRATGSHLTGFMSGQNRKPEGTEETQTW